MRTKASKPGTASSTGGTPRKRVAIDEGRWYAVGPVASQVALCQAVLARKLSPSNRRLVGQYAARASKQPLSTEQVAALGRIAAQAGVATAEPASVPVVASNDPLMQPWGRLVLKPPCRAA
jgi:hypothetical protein